MISKEQKIKLINETIVGIDKDFGESTVMTLGQKNNSNLDVIPTGSLGLDIALGIGGMPRGRIVEIYGPESSGKTTLAMHIIAEAQKKGGICAVIDVEHAFDKEYASNLNIDVEGMYFNQPNNAEQALEVGARLAASGGFDVIVLDSVAALVPKAEVEGDMGDTKMGLQARLMSHALRKLTPIVSENNVLFIFINQLREKIGVMFGNPETTSGGNALKFYASIRLDVRRSIASDKQVKEGDEMIGNETSVRVIKNKVAPPFKKAVFNILFGEGIDRLGEIVDIGTKLEIIQKSGSWFSYQGNKIGQGKSKVKEMLRDNPELMEEIEKLIKEKLNNNSDNA